MTRRRGELPSLKIRAIKELAGIPQWVLWRLEERGADTTKVPITPTGRKASSMDRGTWSPFEKVRAACLRGVGDGVGFVLSQADPYAGVDLDKCIDEAGEIAPWALDYVTRVNSYTEVSPSGRGLRVFVRAKLPPKGRKRGAFEVYDSGRFLTVTGHHLAGSPETIEDRQAQIAEIHSEVFGKKSIAHSDYPVQFDGNLPSDVAELAKRLSRVRKLLENPCSAFPEYPSESEVDLALVGFLVRHGIGHAQIDAALRWRRARQGEKAKDDQYFRRTVEKAFESGEDETASSPRRGLEHLTDLGNARRLARLHGRDLYFAHSWGKWLVWDGRRWVIDADAEVMRRAKATVAAIYEEASRAPDAEARKAIANHAGKSESEPRLKAMISLAASEPEIPILPDDLDQVPWALNALNGTLDLRTGSLQPHRRENLITKMTPAAYDPLARSELWEGFLRRVLPDESVRAFVQRAVGYSLTGSTREQVLFLLWGSGQNGKSTFIETILAALGDYALKTPADTLLARRETGIPNDIARLPGTRFVSAVEMEENRRLAEVRVKELTGGDTISARFMRGEWFDFRPVCKLWIATNHKPTVRGTDRAIWRRLRLVPFTVTVPDEEIDRDLQEKLRGDLPGVLTWAVEGCLAWQREGLKAPDAVNLATEGYREEQDVLKAFLDDRCVIGADYWALAGDIYEAYKDWCDRNGEHADSQKKLAMRLEERGLKNDRRGHAGKRIWRGVTLQGHAQDGDG